MKNPVDSGSARGRAAVEAEAASYRTLARSCHPGGRHHALACTVAERGGVGVLDVLSRAQSPAIADARRELAVALRELGYSYTEIGVMLDRDHTTVIAMVRSLERERREERAGHRSVNVTSSFALAPPFVRIIMRGDGSG